MEAKFWRGFIHERPDIKKSVFGKLKNGKEVTVVSTAWGSHANDAKIIYNYGRKNKQLGCIVIQQADVWFRSDDSFAISGYIEPVQNGGLFPAEVWLKSYRKNEEV